MAEQEKQKSSIVAPGGKVITKIGLAHPVSVPGGVWTFFDIVRDHCSLIIEQYGVRVDRHVKPGRPASSLLVPWSNVIYCAYGV